LYGDGMPRVKLVDSSDAAGQNGPKALPPSAAPKAVRSGTVKQNSQAPHRQSHEPIPLAEQSSGSALSALQQRSTLDSRPSLSTALSSCYVIAWAILPISLMLVICSAILAMLHRIAATERAQDVGQRRLPLTLEPLAQGDGQKSAAQSASQLEPQRFVTTTAEPASPENPPNKPARSADEAAGSSAANSANVIARVLESLEQGEAPCEGVGQTVPRMSECSVIPQSAAVAAA